MGSEINYFLVLGVLLVSSIAGVIIHIPAGIGVLEAVFIAMLSGKIFRRARSLPPCSRRALYYFLPLLLATVAYLLLESRAKKLRQKNQRKLARE